ncbi:hypothetical protein SAMN05443270_1822 [Lacrimispora sphenoides]|uniref:Uncharacterized protein n=1 Tax=Lacrimispora sphenoides JCM 1415 TaxID=1297793 RepID=A0ABY1CE52_9FIRM|nr:hypothetical protein K413DRAFT_0457 [Clostridium sp. ASBs410]SET87601.1 hypothetical protein SAMN05443270_1822 [Lacrimispora sphenoides]SET97566.1 hypothetical protein SAMN02745906_3578 [[Clostridium] sphenoides JCM 1415]SUY52886.1 Uncharacterised protein [Lacrimispora sphenoides]
MDGNPRSPICGFNPRYENKNQYTGALSMRPSIVVETNGLP